MAEGDPGRLRGLLPLILSGVLELAGFAAIIGGFFLISTIAGVFAAGIGLILVAWIIDPPNFHIPVRKQRPPRIEVE